MIRKNGSLLPIHEIIRSRWSPRAFDDRKIQKDQLQRIFEAARWSPSASNEQPWYFITGENGDNTFSKIFDTLDEFNQLWTKTVSALVLAIGRSINLKNRNDNPWFRYDVGQSVAHMTFQATSEGLFVHQMGGFDADRAREAFAIPENHFPLTIVAIGYMGDYASLHPRLQKSELSERVRKSFDEFVFSDKFGNKSNLI